MKELVHKDCGGEIDIVWVYNDGKGLKEIEFKCLKCKKSVYYKNPY